MDQRTYRLIDRLAFGIAWWLFKPYFAVLDDEIIFRTRPDTRAKTVRLALLILRPIPSSIRPIPSPIDLTVDAYDNE